MFKGIQQQQLLLLQPPPWILVKDLPIVDDESGNFFYRRHNISALCTKVEPRLLATEHGTRTG